MKTTEQYINILRSNKQHLTDTYQIIRLGIFGSVARKSHTNASDIDICFESAPIGLFAMSRLKAELEHLLGCTVDLLRMRKELDNTSLNKSVMQDVIYI